MEDIALDDELVLIEASDEFLEEDTDATDAELIAILQKGSLRYAPWLGFNLQERLRGVSNIEKTKRELKVELENDGFKNPEVYVTKADLSDLQIIV